MGCCSHLFKGQDKTFNGYLGQEILPQDDDYYRTRLVNAYSICHNPLDVAKKMLFDSIKFTRYFYLKKLGFVSEIPMVVSYVSKDQILMKIQEEFDESACDVATFKIYYNNNESVRDFLDSEYETDSSYTKDFTKTIELPTYYKSSNTIDVDDITTTYRYSIDGTLYYIRSNDDDSNSVDYDSANGIITLIESKSDGSEYPDTTTDSTNTTTYHTLDIDAQISETKKIASCYCHPDDDGCSYEGDAGCCFKYGSEFENSDEYIGLMIPVKHDGNVVKNKLNKLATNNLGVDFSNLEDGSSDETIKDMFVTYMAKKNGIFNDYVSSVANDTMLKIQLQDEYNSLIYTNEYDLNGNRTLVVKFNNKTIQDHYMDFFNIHIPVPINLIKDLKLRDRYKAIQEILSMIVHSAVVKHLNWYQTDDFNTFVQIGSFAIAVATGPVGIAIWAGSQIGMELLNKYVKSPYLRAIIVIAVIVALNWNAITNFQQTSLVDLTNIGVQITTQLGNAYVEDQTMQEQNDINKYKDETEKANEQINQIKKHMIMHPFEQIDLMFTLPYEIPYINYEMYDTMCSVSYQ